MAEGTKRREKEKEDILLEGESTANCGCLHNNLLGQNEGMIGRCFTSNLNSLGLER